MATPRNHFRLAGWTAWLALAVTVAWCGNARAQANSTPLHFPPPSPPPQPVEAGGRAQQPATPAPLQTYPQPQAPPAPPAYPQAPSTPSGGGLSPAVPLTLPVPSLSPPGAAGPAPWPPAVLPYKEGMPIAAGYRLESEPRMGLVYGGLAVFAVPYVTGLIAAAASGFTKSSGWLAVPLAGPFVAMGGRSIDCSFTEITTGQSEVDLNAKEAACRDSALKEARVVALLTVAGLVQTAGSIIAIAGAVSKDEHLVRQDVYPTTLPASDAPALRNLSLDAGYSHGIAKVTAQVEF